MKQFSLNKMIWHVNIVFFVICLSLVSHTFAQSGGDYTLIWSTIGGGGISAGGNYSLSCIIGRPEAGVMSGGDYELVGGFLPGPENNPPVANAGPDQAVEQESYEGTEVILDGSGSTDVDSTPGTNDDINDFDWFEADTFLASGETINYTFPLGSHTVTLVVTDSYGQSDDDEAIIVVQDTTPPEITCPGDVTLECPADTSVAANGSATATDNCDNSPAIVYGDMIYGECPKVIERTWTATDASGNSSTCVQTITVQDTTPPVITGVPADETVECDSVPPPAEPTATDNCDPDVPIVFTETRTDGDCPSRYTLTRTWTATDDCGNSTAETQVITVQDTTPPVFTNPPQDMTVECDGSGNSAALNAWLTSAATGDTCGSVSVTNDFTALSDGCGATGTATVTWTAMDACGNTATTSATFTIVDTTPPSITCPADVTLECPADTSVAATGAATASDTCGEVTITHSDSSVPGCGNTEVIARTWTAIDECGNSSSCVQTITVVDTTPPVITCPGDVVLECPVDTAPSVTGEATATDTCGDVTITYSDVSVPGPGNTEIITRTWTATDECDNSTSCVQTITVVDATAPVITLNGDATMTLECGIDSYTEEGATAMDICDPDVPVIVGGDTVDTSTCGTYEVTYDATDDSGNSAAQVTRTVIVEDTIPPEFSLSVTPDTLWPANHKMVEITPTWEASDYCDESLDVTLVSITMNEEDDAKGDGHTSDDIQVKPDGSIYLRAERSGTGSGRIYTITYQAVDDSGNVTLGGTTVTVPHDKRKSK